MKSSLLFDFEVDKKNNAVNIKREFDAEVDLVWKAWTTAEILDQWWAPKPFMSKTKHMDFKVGGRRFYAMVSPEGQEHWALQKYTSINPTTNFKFFSTFTDKDENIVEGSPNSDWDLTFTEQNGKTTVNIVIKHKTFESIEQQIKMGFKEGFTVCLESLDQYIAAKFKLRQEMKTSNKARVCTYLNFPGNTEEAFLFYKTVFKSEFSGKGLQRFEDIPAESGHPTVPDAIKKMVLHVELPILGGHILMATDAPKEMGMTLTQGNNMHICLEPETRKETERLFTALSKDGNIVMPLADMFFGAYFGECTDRFGINWMFNCLEKK